MADEFWDRDEVAPATPTPVDRVHRHRPKPERLLTRDEIIIPDVYGGVVGEWRRDQGYMMYLMAKGVRRFPPKPVVVITAVAVVVAIVGALVQLALQAG